MERRRAHTHQLQLITPMTSENLSFAADVVHRAPDTSSYRARVGDSGSNMAHDVSCHLLLCLSNKKAKDCVHMSMLFWVFVLTSCDGNKGHATRHFGCLVSVLLSGSLCRAGPKSWSTQLYIFKMFLKAVLSLLPFQWGQKNHMTLVTPC